MDNVEIEKKLCYFDTRNPYGISDNLKFKEEIEKRGYKETSKENCACANCIFGNTELALYILELKEALTLAGVLASKAQLVINASTFDLSQRISNMENELNAYNKKILDLSVNTISQ